MRQKRKPILVHGHQIIIWMMIFLALSVTPSQVLAAAPPEKHAAFANIASITKRSGVPAKKANQADLLKPIRRQLAFSDAPTDLELSNARIFSEPLCAADAKSLPGENKELSKVLLALRANHNSDDISALTAFLNKHPNSRWRPALELNLGENRFEAGYLTPALKYWTSAWDHSKRSLNPKLKPIADQAIANLVLLEARLGRMADLEKHLTEIKGRTLTGSTGQKVRSSRDGLWSMQHHPEIAFKCGPFAVNTLSYLNAPEKSIGCRETIRKANSTTAGTNLAQLQDWSQQLGLKLQMAKKTSSAKVIVPSIMHWKVAHFCAITAEINGRYRIQDPTFGEKNNLWITPQAISSETDGYFLVPQGPLPTGWTQISKEEAGKVWGKGNAASRDDNQTPDTPHTCSTCPCPPQPAMAAAAAFSMNATLNIADEPVGYKSVIGPNMTVVCNYNYDEGFQPSAYSFSNIGINWSLSWLSYLTVDSSNNLTVRVPGGGYEIFNYSGSSYSPDIISQARMINLGSGSYQRLLPDGSTQNFTISDGTNIYMTSMADPQGNAVTIAFDSNYRITSVTDASGNPPTTLTYVSNTSGNAGFYKVATITDGFGRSASFGYDSTLSFLTSITDAADNVSQFAYDTTTAFINLMTTPYGSTSFYQYIPQGGAPTYPPAGLRFTYPDGSQSVIENWIGEQKETYVWDREASMLYPSDPSLLNYTHCQTTRWLWNQPANSESAVASWTRSPLESPIVYSYPGESSQDFLGTSNKPIQIARQLSGFRNSATLSGTVTPGDVLGIQVTDPLLPWNGGLGLETIYYTVQTADTLSTIAAGLTAAINSDYSLQSFGITASTTSNTIVLRSRSPFATGYSSASMGSPTETISISAGPNPVENATLSGSITAADVLTITVHDTGLSGGQESINYTVQSSDTLATIAQGISRAANADTNLQAIGVSTVWSVPTWVSSTSPVLSIQSNSPNSTTYTSSTSTGASESISLATSSNGIVQQTNYQRNAIGYITQAIDPIGRQTNHTYASNNIDLLETYVPASPSNFLIGQWQYTNPSAPHRPTLYIDGSAQQTQYTYNSFAELATLTDPNSNTTTWSYDSDGFLAQIQGPLAGSNDVTTFTYYGYGLPATVTDSEGYTKSYAYDNLNRLTGTTYPDGTSEQIIYRNRDAVMRLDRLGRSTQDSYDCMDQLSSETDPLGRKTSYCWCTCGSLQTLTDPLNQTTNWQRDLEGRVTQKTYADGTSVNTTYEPMTSRIFSSTDSLSQVKRFLYNIDDTLAQKNYLSAVNPTSAVSTKYDPIFSRVISVSNGWGQYSYVYNPYVTGSTATTGGGRLATVSNNVIANSMISYSYDALGRTTNRSINGSSNSVNWTYDAMSRVTSEQNALGTFNYSYVDDTAGSSKGTTRLASISYPNSQVTNFNYYGNTGDQRLQQILNLNPSGAVLSQFNYNYDSAGQITLWQQQQNGDNQFHNLQYDPAGQLTSDLMGSGSPQLPYSQLFYNYDCAANRKSVQSKSMQTMRVGGTVTSGDTLTVSVSDKALSGGVENVAYTVQSGDSLSSIAANIAAAITSDSNLMALGVNSVSNSNSLYVKSTSNNITTYSVATSSGASETVTPGIYRNGNTNVIVGGTKTTGDNLTVKVLDPALSGGSSSASYTVGASDTLTTIASGIKAAINSNTSLSAIGVTSTSTGAVVNIVSTSTNATNYATSVTSSATETLSVATNLNQSLTAALSGTKTTGDILTIRFYDAGLTGGTELVNYTVLSTDTLTSMATGLTSAINADSNLAAVGITATSSNSVITINSKSISQTTYRQSVSSGGTEKIDLLIAINTIQTAVIGGSRTAGDVLTVTAYDPGLSGGKESVSYTVQSSDNLATITSALATAINADTNLNAIGVTATAVTTVVNISSASMNNTNYTQNTNTGATETVSISNTTGVLQASFNNVNELTSTSPGGAVHFQGTTADPIKSAVVNPSQVATISGTITPGDHLSISVHDSSLNQAITVSYSVLSGDTTTSIATALKSFINANTTLTGLGITATSLGPVITLFSSSINSTLFTQSVSTGATEAITLGSSGGSLGTINQSEEFVANPVLSAGSNLASVTAISGGGTATTNTYPIKLGSASSQSFTFDLNGNMTGDGTNTYQWDAENRLIQINYPGSGNDSQFTYDPFGHLAEIVETTSSTVSSTTQLVWTGNQKAETRNSAGNLISQFFNYGEMIAGNQYYYIRDHLGSVREMTDSAVIIQAAYSYDAYGRVLENNISLEADFGYNGYYRHLRSGTLWPPNRQYQATIGRWMSRDPLGEYAGANLYEFATNAPVVFADPSGLDIVQVTDPKANKGFGHCAYLVGNSADGWDYYSFAPNGVTSGHYPSLGGFYGANGRYTSGNLYPTTPAQDQAARDSASNYGASDYKPFRCNCADFAEAGMNAGGISTHSSLGPNIPVSLTGSGGYDVSPPLALPDPPHGPISGEQ